MNGCWKPIDRFASHGLETPGWEKANRLLNFSYWLLTVSLGRGIFVLSLKSDKSSHEPPA